MCLDGRGKKVKERVREFHPQVRHADRSGWFRAYSDTALAAQVDLWPLWNRPYTSRLCTRSPTSTPARTPYRPPPPAADETTIFFTTSPLTTHRVVVPRARIIHVSLHIHAHDVSALKTRPVIPAPVLHGAQRYSLSSTMGEGWAIRLEQCM